MLTASCKKTQLFLNFALSRNFNLSKVPSARNAVFLMFSIFSLLMNKRDVFINLGDGKEKGVSPDHGTECLRRAVRTWLHSCHNACGGRDLSNLAGQ